MSTGFFLQKKKLKNPKALHVQTYRLTQTCSDRLRVFYQRSPYQSMNLPREYRSHTTA